MKPSNWYDFVEHLLCTSTKQFTFNEGRVVPLIQRGKLRL